VGRYTRQLAGHLGEVTGEHELELFYFDFKRKGSPFPIPNATFRANRWIPGRIAQASWKRLNWPPFDALAGACDLYHFPNFVLPPLRRGKAVVTIHDVSFMRYPQFAEAANLRYLTAKIKDTVRRADAIITISQFSADEIVELLGVPAERVFPIHLGIDASFAPQSEARVAAIRQTYGLERPYLLAVGTIEPRKNLPFIVDVFEQIKGFDGDLVLAGGPGWKHGPIFDRIASSPLRDRIRHLVPRDEDDLPAIYGGAACLLQPSFYEGFGFPPIEAMACGTPVVSSRGGSLPEIIGAAAPLLETDSPESWCAAIMEQIETGSGDAEMRRQHAAQFKWQTTAERTWDVYARVTA
jgi:glycosyltransferase involved in cell wall biosynthesis